MSVAWRPPSAAGADPDPETPSRPGGDPERLDSSRTRYREPLPDTEPSLKIPRSPLRARAALFWRRHRTLLWTLHSFWALATGVAVIWLARERYGFVKWVVLFLLLTWASTLFLGRGTSADDDELPAGTSPRPPGVGAEVTSYLTRTLYQETLFFLIPFFAYSTVVGSRNVVFIALLGGFATLSCLDLVFDRLLRRSGTFGMTFFATVVFAALVLLLPLLLGVSTTWSLQIASVVAVVTALPIALRTSAVTRATWIGVTAVVLVFPGVAFLAPSLVPAVPLRLDSATFATEMSRSTLEPVGVLEDGDPPPVGGIAVVVAVFAPGSLPATVRLVWYHDGLPIRTSREIDIVAHGEGFRIWDAIPPADLPAELAGRWRVVLRTDAGSIFGTAELDLPGGS